MILDFNFLLIISFYQFFFGILYGGIQQPLFLRLIIRYQLDLQQHVQAICSLYTLTIPATFLSASSLSELFYLTFIYLSEDHRFSCEWYFIFLQLLFLLVILRYRFAVISSVTSNLCLYPWSGAIAQIKLPKACCIEHSRSPGKPIVSVVVIVAVENFEYASQDCVFF